MSALLLVLLLRAGRRQRLLRRGRVRARAQPARQDRAARRGRRKRRRGGDRAARQDRRVALRLPGRDHDGLDRHRLPRRAGAGELLEPVFGGLSHGVAVGLSLAIAFTLVTALHISVGEQVPKMLAIARAERIARRVARPLTGSASLTAPVTYALSGLSNAIVRLFGVDPTDIEEQPHRRGPEADHRPLADRRHARPRRGGDARRRLPPARAGGARGDDADPRGGHRRRLRDGGDGAAALRHLRPHAAGRDRGREPRPGQGDRPQQQPRPPLHERRARGADRAGRPRRA